MRPFVAVSWHDVALRSVVSSALREWATPLLGEGVTEFLPPRLILDRASNVQSPNVRGRSLGGTAPGARAAAWMPLTYSAAMRLSMCSMHDFSGKSSPAGSNSPFGPPSEISIALMMPSSTYMAVRLQRLVWKPRALLGPS